MLNFTWKNQTHRLDESNPYAVFSLEQSDTEKETLAKLSITRPSTYDNYGDLESLRTEIQQFLLEIGEYTDLAVAASIAELLENTILNVLQGFAKESAWITFRATLPSHAFDTPRWHFDGKFFPASNETQAKFATVIKGPGTLFHPLDASIRSEFSKESDRQGMALRTAIQENKAGEFLSNPANRQAFVNFVKKSEDTYHTKTHQMGANQGGIFLVGSEKEAAIHSEPAMTEPRLFVSVVPGSKEEIADLKKRWTTPK